MCRPPTKKAMKPQARAPEEYPVPDPKDASNPDRWVKRHPAMVRLTGKHPFNVEPPLPLLMAHGHSTPASIHYVRNHGKVPVTYASDADVLKLEREWRVALPAGHGVASSASLSLLDFKKLPFAERPVLLVCAGNRRKEQNMVKRTIGFNWGAAGLGMSSWGGCHLADVLAAHGVSTDPATWDDGRHVCFRGPVKELPAGADGSYGTSVPLRYAMDKANDVMVCWEQNGQRLQADHGFPLRIIIPGFIGGRMIKWLSEIKVSDACSDNHYHFKDNRVLPVNVTPEQAEAEGWWFKPDYIINDLNINSAISRPGHGEVLDLATCGATYDVQGYAYGGGGRMIIRVEVTLDGGQSWHLVKDDAITHPPNTPTKAGKYWGWCRWTIPVPTSDLLKAENVACRAWDCAMNTQPKELTWNVMGMLNNPWFTVVKHFECETSGAALRFEHPTLAGQQTGGWMTPEAKRRSGAVRTPETQYKETMRDMHAARAADLAIEEDGGLALSKIKRLGLAASSTDLKSLALASVPQETSYTMEEVAKHDTPSDTWIVVKGVVYDATKYLEQHPGGAQSITMVAGTDATEDFEAIHSKKAWANLEEWRIGVLGASGATARVEEPLFQTNAQGVKVALGKAKIKLKLVLREKLSDDSFRLRFALPAPDMVLGLPVGKHILIYGKDKEDKMVARAYTPTTADEVRGHVDFVIKAYRPLPPRFPDGGALSQYLCDRIPLYTDVEFRGPLGEIEYLGRGRFDVAHGSNVRRIKAKHVGLIAGGTGLTPMLQLITAALAEKKGRAPSYSLLLGNRSEGDILCRDELEAASAQGVVDLHLTLDKPPADWKHFTGFVDAPMLEKTMPPPGPETFIFCCGPPPMIKGSIAKLEARGHAADQIFCF